jgi:adenine/guanine phosphoribosyltransferase-like PRPP-binding protein
MTNIEDNNSNDLKSDKLISAHEKMFSIKFLAGLLEEYGSLENLASALNYYIDEKYGKAVSDKYTERDIFSVADLSRYINRKALPTDERKNFIINFILDKIEPANLIVKGILGMKIQDVYFIDTNFLISDLEILEKIAFIVARTKLFRRKFDRILSGSSDGTPFAILLAHELEIPVTYVKYEPPLGIEECISKDIEIFEQNKNQKIYLQKNKIHMGERVLIVDDIIRTGRTIKTLIEMVEEYNASVPVVISLIGIGKHHNIDLEGNANRLKPEIIILHRIS